MTGSERVAGPHRCRFCDAAFARQEHLSRHIRTHTREKPYRCPQPLCAKAFSRRDVLSRHLEAHRHASSAAAAAAGSSSSSTTATAARACLECAALRVRCSKADPCCARCEDRQIQCVYPDAVYRRSVRRDGHDRLLAGREVVSSAVEDDQDDGVAPGQAADVSLEQQQQQQHMPAAGQIPLPYPDAVQQDNLAGDATASLPIWPHHAVGSAEPAHLGFGLGSVVGDGGGGAGIGLSGVNWLSPDFQQDIAWAELAMPFQHSTGGVSFDGGMAWSVAPHPEMSVSVQQQQPPPVSWTPTTATAAALGGPPGMPTNDGRSRDSPHHVHTSPLGQAQTPSTSGLSRGSASERRHQQQQQGVLYVDGAEGRAPFGGRLQSDHHHRQLRGGARPSYTAAVLASPGDVRRGFDSDAVPLVSEAAYLRLRQMMAVQQQQQGKQQAGPDDASNNLPDLTQARSYTDLFFDRFHPSFLRRSCLIFETPRGWLLLLAVVATGAGYAGDTSCSRVLHQALDTLTCTCAVAQGICGVADSHRASPPGPGPGLGPGPGSAATREDQLQELQACLLNVIGLVHDGDQAARRRGLMRRHHLADQCRAMGLLSSSSSSGGGGGYHSSSDGDRDHVSAWVLAESEKRTGFMAWLLDSMLASEFSVSTSFRLYDTETPLPYGEACWERPTAELVAALDQQQQQQRTVTIPEALEMLYMEKRLPPGLSEFAKVLLTYAICRRMDEASYHLGSSSSLPSWTPNASIQSRGIRDSDGHARESAATSLQQQPTPSPLVVRWRNSSCDSLDVLHWDANMTCAGAGGFEHPTVLHLHLSRLLILSPVRHMQTVTGGGPSGQAQTSMSSRLLDEAFGSIRRWAILDQFKARLSVVHAGAILWHVRRYKTGSFIEPFAVFLAVVVLWSYSVSTLSVLQQQQQQQHQSGAVEQGVDNVDSDDDDDQNLARFIHLDRPCDDEIVQIYVRDAGNRMDANMVRVGNICSPGAPQKLLREGLRMLSGGDRAWTTCDLSRAPLPGSQAVGLNAELIERLVSLARATSTW